MICGVLLSFKPSGFSINDDITLNIDSKDYFSDCVNFNLVQSEFLEKDARFSDFVSCDPNKANNLEWSCSLKQWNSTSRDLTFFIQRSSVNNTLNQNASTANLFGSIQCRIAASEHHEHSFLFQFGPLTTTPTGRMSKRFVPPLVQPSEDPPVVPVSLSSFTMGQTSAISVLIGISIISILAAISCGCYHRRRMKSVIEMWNPDEVKYV